MGQGAGGGTMSTRIKKPKKRVRRQGLTARDRRGLADYFSPIGAPGTKRFGLEGARPDIKPDKNLRKEVERVAAKSRGMSVPKYRAFKKKQMADLKSQGLYGGTKADYLKSSMVYKYANPRHRGGTY